MMVTAIALLLALGAAAGCFWIVQMLLDRSRLARRVQMASGNTSAGLESRLAEGVAGVGGAAEQALSKLGSLMPLGQDDRRKIATALSRAGFRSANAITVVLGAKMACLFGGLLIGILTLSGYKPGMLGIGIGIGGGFLIGVILNLVPEMVVTQLAKSRLRVIQTALPDALDLLIVSLEAGLTFERALHRAVTDLRTFQPVLAEELGQASLDVSVHGRTREDAMGRVADRLDSTEFRDFATTVAQSERHGTPIAESLRKLASSLRIDTIARMQAKMARLPTLLLLPSVALLLPGIMVIVGGPSILKLIEQLGEIGGG